MNAPEPTLRVAIACGGTGGHLFPGLAVGRELAGRGCAVTLLISPKEVDQQAVRSAAGMEVRTLPAVGLQNGRRIGFAAGFMKSLWQTTCRFRSARPDAVLAMGGFTSAPPILAAGWFGASTAIHESNSIPGRANRWLSRLVDHIFVGFPECASFFSARTTVSGTPVRPEFGPADRAACRADLGLDPARPVLLVLGGSQGASGLNQLVISGLPLLGEQAPSLQFIHLTGNQDFQSVKEAYDLRGASALVYPFFPDVHRLMGAASMAVSRAGASSLAEIAAMRLPAVLVPFPAAVDNHQFHNAAAFARSGAAILLGQQTARAEDLLKSVLHLLHDDEGRQVMIAALGQWHTTGAAGRIAERIVADGLAHQEERTRRRHSRSGNPFAVPLKAGRAAAGVRSQNGRTG